MSTKPIKSPSSYTFVRHGESVSNSQGLCCGSAIDSPLTPFGMQQAAIVGDLLLKSGDKYDIVIHSSLSRARDTAQIIAERLNLVTVEDSRLNEHEVGEWEHKPWSDVSGAWLGRQDPPKGESWTDFYSRIKEVIENLLSKYNNPLIVSHGGVFLACLHNKTIDLDFMPTNGTAYRFNYAKKISPCWDVEILCKDTSIWKSPSK